MTSLQVLLYLCPSKFYSHRFFKFAFENNYVNNLPAPEIITTAERVPVPLINRENVCFFNSVVQVLFSLIPFRERILSDLVDNHVIRCMKQLFRIEY